MPISGGKYVAPTWANGTSPAINQTELQAMSNTLANIPIGNGGTGATTAAAARTNLEITPANIGAMPASGGTFSNSITVQGTVTASGGFIGNASTATSATSASQATKLATARNLQVSLTETTAKSFNGTANVTDIGVSGILPIENGGTGANSAAGVRSNLGLGNTTGALPVANGGTGSSNGATGLANLFAAGATVLSSNQYGNNLPSSGTTGQLFFKIV